MTPEDHSIPIIVYEKENIRGHGYFCSIGPCKEEAAVIATCVLNGSYKSKTGPLCFTHGLNVSEYFMQAIKNWEAREDDQIFNWA